MGHHFQGKAPTHEGDLYIEKSEERKGEAKLWESNYHFQRGYGYYIPEEGEPFGIPLRSFRPHVDDDENEKVGEEGIYHPGGSLLLTFLSRGDWRLEGVHVQKLPFCKLLHNDSVAGFPRRKTFHSSEFMTSIVQEEYLCPREDDDGRGGEEVEELYGGSSWDFPHSSEGEIFPDNDDMSMFLILTKKDVLQRPLGLLNCRGM